MKNENSVSFGEEYIKKNFNLIFGDIKTNFLLIIAYK